MRVILAFFLMVLPACKATQTTTASESTSPKKEIAFPDGEDSTNDSESKTPQDGTGNNSTGSGSTCCMAGTTPTPTPVPPNSVNIIGSYPIPPTLVDIITPPPQTTGDSSATCTMQGSVQDWNTDGIVEILGDGIDKGGFDFTISTGTNIRVNTFYINMRALGLNSISLELYEGGIEPGNGLLISSINKNSNLDIPYPHQMSFVPSEPVTLKIGVNYFIVLKGSGSGSMEVALNAFGFIANGSTWLFDGNNWLTPIGYTLGIGFEYEASCQ